MSRNTLLLCVPSGQTAATILRGSVYPALQARGDGLRFLILSPLVRDSAFVAEFGAPGVELHELAMHRPGWLEARLLRLFQESHLRRYPTPGRKVRRDEIRDREHSPWAVTVARAAVSHLAPRWWTALSDVLVPDTYYAGLFSTHRPDLVLVATPGLNFAELPLLKRARREGVPVMAIDTGWDHFTRLEPVHRVDWLVVWNESMRRQAVELHGYPPTAVEVCGVPQFDIYADPGLRASREAFFARISADPTRRLLTLATSPPLFYTHHGALIEILRDAIKRDVLGVPAQLLVRPHPADDFAQYERYAGVEHVIIDRPYRPSVDAVGGMAVDVTRADRLHLADTLSHSDVVVNISSTVTIEACIFDRPVINVIFDGVETLPYIRSARRLIDYDHYREILRTGAVRLAPHPQELIDHLRHYLRHPESDREARRQVVAEQCGPIDGRAGERLARHILARLGC